ncbi:protein fem-1 homolog C isoform X2 [Drosophila rhopaloa]|uniref:Protein fem-1 homolog C isoform X2 n=1 Tax=Drosophila rhopaloa TaxID=1041015 RepID=A0A6P4F7G1_DRORH|nr:protein fem-1 homolog C isoform X2 [Drosophila rhopaloa]
MRSLEGSRRQVEQLELEAKDQDQDQDRNTREGQALEQANARPSMANERKQSSPKVELTKLSHELIEECKRSLEDSLLSRHLRHELEKLPRDSRRELVRKQRNGCAPLFTACKRGAVVIAEYLITICEADIEQRGHFEVPEDNSFHYVSPLWAAVVSGKLSMVKYLVRIGCDINATSDSGSTPVRSACYMTHVDIVKFLVENGADIKRPNINGGTCLINSVQSVQLCLYLVRKGADINARDIQDKTALHYAIQEHRLDTTKMLIEQGADPYAKSRYGDDALRTACLKGAHQIFDYLKKELNYLPARLAEAHELMGSTFLDEHNESRVCILHWRMAHHIRAAYSTYIEKKPQVPLRTAYENAVEFSTLEELDNIATDMDAMRTQSLLICERVLGLTHKDMLFRLTFRGASYADSLQLQRCIDLWRFLLEVRVSNWSILHFETCFAAQALVRLMLDLHVQNSSHIRSDARARFVHQDNVLPRFEDVLGVFRTLAESAIVVKHLLLLRPVFRRQQENYDRVMRCLAHLIYLLINTVHTEAQNKLICQTVHETVVVGNLRSASTADTMLHLCASRLNVIKSGYITDDNFADTVFPNADVIKLLIQCGVDVNIKNEAKSTPLHVACQPYNYDNEIVHLLLKCGADIDQPNRADKRPYDLIASNPTSTIPLLNFVSLQCLAATAISKHRIPYHNQLHRQLEKFVRSHEP